MNSYVAIERDSDRDITNVFGPFPSIEAGMNWLKEVHVPAWIKEYEAETGFKTNVDFYGNGGADNYTCTSWLVCQMETTRRPLTT